MNRFKVCCMLVMLYCLPLLTIAQTMQQRLKNIPDSIFPYLSQNVYKDIVNSPLNETATMVNVFGDTLRQKRLTNSDLEFETQNFKVQAKLLVRNLEKDTILCFVKTFFGSAAESEVRFYDKNWCLLPSEKFVDLDTLQLLACPDTMKLSVFENLCSLIEPKMIFIFLSPTEPVLEYEYSLPLLNSEETIKVRAIMCKRKLKWNGEIFN